MSFTRLNGILVLLAAAVLEGGNAAAFIYHMNGAEKPKLTQVTEKADQRRRFAGKTDESDKDKQVTLESVPPVVTKTVPEAGADEVDPSLSEIKVTFSKNMQDGNWSWAKLSTESFPKVLGKPTYLAHNRTCVLPVKLEPGKTYAIWVNSQKFGDFKDTEGRAAVPYLLVFKTKK